MAKAFSIELEGRIADAVLSPRGSERAFRRGVDRGSTQVRKNLVQLLAAQTGATKPALNRRIKRTKRPRPGSVSAEITISKGAIPIRDMTPSLSKQAVTVTADIDVRKGRGPEELRVAFSPKGTTNRKRIWQRVIEGGRRVPRLPLRVAVGPSPAVMFGPIGDKFLEDQKLVLSRFVQTELRVEAINEGLKLLRR